MFFFLNLHYPVLNLFFFSFRECAGLLRGTGSLISTRLHALHGGISITTRYSSIYMLFNISGTLIMATSGLRRRKNPRSSSCHHQSFLIGCNNIFLQRYESRLMNLQSGDDWQEMCATTPGHIQGKYFNGPTSCATWVS